MFYRECPGLFAIGQQAVAQLAYTIAGRRSNLEQDDLKGQPPVADIYALARALSWTEEVQKLTQAVAGLDGENPPLPAAEIPWGHNVLLPEKIKHGYQNSPPN